MRAPPNWCFFETEDILENPHGFSHLWHFELLYLLILVPNISNSWPWWQGQVGRGIQINSLTTLSNCLVPQITLLGALQWITLGPFGSRWLPSGSRWFTFGSLWITSAYFFGSLWLTFGSLLHPCGSLFGRRTLNVGRATSNVSRQLSDPRLWVTCGSLFLGSVGHFSREFGIAAPRVSIVGHFRAIAGRLQRGSLGVQAWFSTTFLKNSNKGELNLYRATDQAFLLDHLVIYIYIYLLVFVFFLFFAFFFVPIPWTPLPF